MQTKTIFSIEMLFYSAEQNVRQGKQYKLEFSIQYLC